MKNRPSMQYGSGQRVSELAHLRSAWVPDEKCIFGEPSHEHSILLQQSDLALPQHPGASPATSDPGTPIHCIGFSCIHSFIHWHLFPPSSQLLFPECYLWIKITGKVQRVLILLMHLMFLK